MSSHKAIGEVKCCDEKKADLTKVCRPTKEENDRFKKHQEQRNRGRKKETKRHPGGKEAYRIRDMTWKDKHCKELLFDLESNPQKIKHQLDEMAEELQRFKSDLSEHAGRLAMEAAEDKVKKSVGVAACEMVGAAIGALFGFLFGGVGAAPGAAGGAAAGAAICGAAAVADTLMDIPSLWDDAKWVKEQISAAKSSIQELKRYQQSIIEISKIKNSSLSDSQKKEAIAKIKEPLLKEQERAVNKNRCLRLKRCEITPYQKSKASLYPHGAGGKKWPMDRLFGLDRTDGCCPGQRAHHIVPAGKVRECRGYDHNKAPTVCVEGGNNSGTHGKLHVATDKNTKAMIEGKYNRGDTSCNKTPSSMECTIEASAQAMEDLFGCDKECVTRKLKAFYYHLCGEGVVLKDRNGKIIEKAREDTGREGL